MAKSLLILLIVGVSSAAPAPTADDIMARVAENQDRAEGLRSEFVYQQKLLIRLRDGKGKLVREEADEYVVTPTPDGTKKELTSSRKFGRPWKLAEEDADMVKDLRHDLTNDRKAKDGLSRKLFPLTAKEQRKYDFKLAGEEVHRGLAVYRITFAPKVTGSDINADAGPWTGEALVSRNDYQPVLITTELSRKVPLLIRTMLGTNVHGLGFSVRYQKFDEGLWFPVSYGTEFRFRALFFYSRSVVVSLENTGFQRAKVDSAIAFDELQ
jgi:hypothetical protein